MSLENGIVPKKVVVNNIIVTKIPQKNARVDVIINIVFTQRVVAGISPQGNTSIFVIRNIVVIYCVIDRAS